MSVETYKEIDEALGIVEKTGVELVQRDVGMDIALFALEYEVEAFKENIIENFKAMPSETRNEILQLNGGTVESYLKSIHDAVIKAISIQTKTVTPAKVDHASLRKHIPK